MARAVATAASTALPPSLRIARPALAPGADTATTTPLRNSALRSPAGVEPRSSKNGISASDTRRFIRIPRLGAAGGCALASGFTSAKPQAEMSGVHQFITVGEDRW